MRKIHKANRAGRTTLQEPPNDEVPRWCARQCMMLLRMTHFAFDEMAKMVRVMPPEQKTLYQYLADVELRPSFFDALKLIDQSEERGILTQDEAASLRAGRVGDIENPLPAIEGNGDDARA
ncbi:MAG: hypothetical protein OJF51_002409 [Nitrospira sp.]|nr:MAG: hypothetical protein OJF51_002409 [Nitrospira sp.]